MSIFQFFSNRNKFAQQYKVFFTAKHITLHVFGFQYNKKINLFDSLRPVLKMDQKLSKIRNFVSKESNLKRQTSYKPNIGKYDILKKHHKFIRDSDSQDQNQKIKTYEQQLAKQKYDELFKQYALVDLTKYQIGKIGCRWRTEKQVIEEKGQKICANIKCHQMATNVYQMNFCYIQQEKKKNALVKVSVCKNCSVKLNFNKKLKQISSGEKKQNQQIQSKNKQDLHQVKIEAND